MIISDYLDNVRSRLNLAVRAGNLPEIQRLSVLLGEVMRDGDKTGEAMPWDNVCPICGSPVVVTPDPKPVEAK
jgi:hypothetical protein